MKKLFTYYILILSISFSIFSCQKSAEEYYNSALDYTKNKNLISALESLNSAIEVNPNYADAYLERGRIKHNIHFIKATLNSNDNEVISSNQLFEELVSDTLFEGALKDYKMALVLDPNLVLDVQIGRGNIFYSLKDYPKAIAEYKKVLQVDSTNKLVTINAVMCNFFFGDSIGAFLLLDQMVMKDPKNAESYYIRAIQKIGYKKKACEDLEKALKLYDADFIYLHKKLDQQIKKLLKINCNN